VGESTSVATEIAVVRSFLEALERLDLDGAAGLLHPDVVYQNVPLPPARGARAVERQLQALVRWSTGFEARVHHIAGDGAVVLTERTDVLVRGRFRAEFWVCGTFEVQDRRIVLWRDHFDYLNVTWGVARGAVRAVLGR
jgi:limonene-1,2-epoxide hydrolase